MQHHHNSSLIQGVMCDAWHCMIMCGLVSPAGYSMDSPYMMHGMRTRVRTAAAARRPFYLRLCCVQCVVLGFSFKMRLTLPLMDKFGESYATFCNHGFSSLATTPTGQLATPVDAWVHTTKQAESG